MTTPTPPADAPTPRTEEHIEGYGHKVARFMPAFGEPAHDVYVKADFARQLERELAGTLHSLDAMSKAHADKVEELAAKDARIAALEKDRDEFHGQYRMKCDVETKTLHIELADLRAQLQAANERAEKAEAALQEQFRLYCEETKKHNATSALLAKAKDDFDYAAQALTEHAEAVGVSPDHINYIEETTKAIISAWANKTSLEQTNAALKAEVERLTKNIGCARQQGSTQFCAEAVAAIAQRDAARALNDRLAGALDKYTDQTCASDELVTEACDALDAYAKSKEAAKQPPAAQT